MAIKKTENKTESKVEYIVEVTRAKEVNGAYAFDMIANGVKIYGCWYREGNKDGKDWAVVSFPSYKSNDNYWNHCWFPVSKELTEDIAKQINNLL